jgi:hypothetical protein
MPMPECRCHNAVAGLTQMNAGKNADARLTLSPALQHSGIHLKGLSQEMDLAFDDMYGSFRGA